MSLPFWKPRPTRLLPRVWEEFVPSRFCGMMVETKSLAGDLDAGRKLTGEALWRRDHRLARCLWPSRRPRRVLLLWIEFP